jgi:mRNA-degrading endonuclease toxin of MazEF toxin-antitoxin module
VVEPKPRQGDVYWTNPDPTKGGEQAKSRPFVIVSVDQLNQTSLDLSLAVSLTRTDFGNALHLAISASEGGLREDGFAMPEAAARDFTRAPQWSPRQPPAQDP